MNIKNTTSNELKRQKKEKIRDYIMISIIVVFVCASDSIVEGLCKLLGV